MQFQADVSDARVSVSSVAELSAAGAAQVAGLAAGLYHGHEVTDQIQRTLYQPTMEPARRARKLDGWRAALAQALHH
jgi:glycerol kinase